MFVFTILVARFATHFVTRVARMSTYSLREGYTNFLILEGALITSYSIVDGINVIVNEKINNNTTQSERNTYLIRDRIMPMMFKVFLAASVVREAAGYFYFNRNI